MARAGVHSNGWRRHLSDELSGALLTREYTALRRLVEDHAASAIFTKAEVALDEPRRFIAKLEVLSGKSTRRCGPLHQGLARRSS